MTAEIRKTEFLRRLLGSAENWAGPYWGCCDEIDKFFSSSRQDKYVDSEVSVVVEISTFGTH